MISSLTSMGGVSGAVLILPFQVSFLGFSGPAVSPTNLLFNIVAIPSGVYSYYHEKRMVWPLTWVIIAGIMPGLFFGAIMRIKYLPDARTFKLFAGAVLLYVGIRLLMSLLKKASESGEKSAEAGDFRVTAPKFGFKRIRYLFNDTQYDASTLGLFGLSLIVGLVGGAYGIGGGAIIAPFLVTVFRLPVHSVGGAALMSTFLSSIVGVIIYTIISPFYSNTQLTITPDWFLGALFGIGGAFGMYLGARMQKFIPARLIKGILAICILPIAIKYILGFFL
jgi:uncharacterized protein